MKRLIFAIIILMVCINPASAAPGDTIWTRTYGGSEDDYAYSVQQTTDGGYIIAGKTESFGAGETDFYVVKTDGVGDTLWTRTYGGSAFEQANDVQQTKNGGYIIAGRTSSYGAGICDIYLVKTDNIGDTLWTRVYGGYNWEDANAVRQTADGGFIVIGNTWSAHVYNSDIYLLKTDSYGDMLWARIYDRNGDIDDGFSVLQTDDGGYMVAGVTCPYGYSRPDFYLMKIDSIGNIVWTRNYGGDDGEAAHDLIECTDGGFVMVGYTNSYGAGFFDYYMVKVNDVGDTIFTRIFGGSGEDMANSVIQTPDNGFLIAGTDGSFGELFDYYLVRTDSNGDTLWTRSYDASRYDKAYSVLQTMDGNYIIAGETAILGIENREMRLLKIEGDQLVDVQDDQLEKPSNIFLLNNYPNPFNATTTISYNIQEDGHVRLDIFDILGQKITTLIDSRAEAGSHSVNWNASLAGQADFASGFYFYRLTTGHDSVTKKMVLLK
jgi:hypothetical protein